MTSREREILEIIKKDPLISQQELAEILRINRSSVAVHIGNLMKKGYIKGKGYIVSEDKKVCVIGGSNIDLQGFPNTKLTLMDSNPGKINTSLGGVGRNIAENLAKMAVPVRLLSVVGDDFYGKKTIEESRFHGIDTEDILMSKEFPTSMFLAIMDEENEMKVAISQMDIFEKIDVNFIKERELLIKNNASLLCLDTNIPQETIEYICHQFKDIPIFVDPVSTTKAMKLKNCFAEIHTIKPNVLEAEKLLNITINDIDDVRKAGQLFLDKGVKRAFVSLGKEGVFVAGESSELLIKAVPDEIKSTTGAGDAFMAGVIDAYIKGRDIENTLKHAIGASLTALQSYSTINPEMSKEEIIKNTIESKLTIKTF